MMDLRVDIVIVIVRTTIAAKHLDSTRTTKKKPDGLTNPATFKFFLSKHLLALLLTYLSLLIL